MKRKITNSVVVTDMENTPIELMFSYVKSMAWLYDLTSKVEHGLLAFLLADANPDTGEVCPEDVIHKMNGLYPYGETLLNDTLTKIVKSGVLKARKNGPYVFDKDFFPFGVTEDTTMELHVVFKHQDKL